MRGQLLKDSASLLYGLGSHGNGVLWPDGCGGERDADGVSWLLCICPEIAGGLRT